MSSSPYFLLCLKISSERWKRERDELLPLLLQSKKRRRSFSEEEEEKACRKENNAKKAGGGGGLLLVLPPPPPPEDLLLDLNEEPNPLWEEMKAAGKARVVFKRRLSESDVRRSLARCILNRREMREVLVPALTEEEVEQVCDMEKKLRVVVVVEGGLQSQKTKKKSYEMKVVCWPSLKQFALVNGRTEFVHGNGLLKGDIIQLSYFRFGRAHDGPSQQQQQLGLLIHCRPEFLMTDRDQEKHEEEETVSSSHHPIS